MNYPEMRDFDALITTGGAQDAPKLEEYPELMREVLFLQEVIAAKKPTLGICLGGQLLGCAFGAKATRSPEPEFGDFPVMVTEEGEADGLLAEFPSPFNSIHWHFDMMGVPENALILAHSQGCPVQAVKFKDHVYGVQFHWDFTREVLIKNLKVMIDKMPHGNYIQPAEEMLLADFKQMEENLGILLDKSLNKN